MMKLRPISWAALVLLSGLTASAAAQETRRPYIVQLQDAPAASYTGGVAGLAATKPTAGSRFDFHAAEVQDYVRYLGQQQNLVLSTVPSEHVLATYDVVLNGFAAMLTDAEVLTLQSNAAVLGIQAGEERHLNTISTPTFLGLDATNGLWSKLGGQGLSGENMIIGVIDGGVWPENPAFADRVDANGVPTHDLSGTLAYGAPPAAWKGSCVASKDSQDFQPAKHCNNKLLGAYYFSDSFKSQNKVVNWSEFIDSPRDSIGGAMGHGGHGDHTASTAAGNYGATAIINGAPLGIASGMAPRARVATYKVCWTYDDATVTDGTGSRNSCFSPDIVSAVNQAVKDGVHVINYSISGGESVNDSVEQAFLAAANAGVFVATSAGNNGPANQVAHVSPWLTTVAASTHDRDLRANVILGNAASYAGASYNPAPLPSAALIRAEDAALGGGNATLCFSDASAAAAAGQALLDPAKVANKIVVCTRGSNARVDKSLAVLNAGGIGMVMMDNGSGLVAEAHSVPTVHVSAADGTAIKSYAVAQGNAATAAMSKMFNAKKPSPIMAGFSSRGPNRYDSNVLKPDLTAPGVDVIANVTQPGTVATRDAIVAGAAGLPAWGPLDGTSMASPHIAGLALLLRQKNPSWSPAAVKSALMTTAFGTLNDGLTGMQNGLLPWAQGAGHINANAAADPGLVYDLGKNDYIKYQCKVNKAAVSPASACTTVGTLDETYNLNLPSFTVGLVLGTVPVTMTRSVTNVGSSTATYTSNATLPGYATLVTPASLTLAPGETKSFTLKITNVSAVNNAWAYGSLTWSDGAGHIVRSPVQALVGKAITSPADLTSARVSGSTMFPVKTGYSGTMTASKGGLKDVTMSDAVTLTPQATSAAQLTPICAAGQDTASVKIHTFTVPANTIVARFALRNADVGAPGLDDFDLMVMKSDGSGVVYSGNDGSNEAVQLSSPSAGTYRACVVAWGGGSTMTHRLSSWIVTPSDTGGNLVVAVPAKVVAGNNTTVGMSWSGLAANKRYVGGAQFRDQGGAVQSTTVLRIETGASVPQPQGERVEPQAKD